MSFIKSKKFVLLVLAILGLLTSAELFAIFLKVNFDPYALSASFCSINEIIDCDGVEKSMLSQIFGIPFACWGMFLYSLIIFFIFVDKIKKVKFLGFLEVFKNPQMYIAALGYIAFTLSLILAVTAFVQIKKVCLLCAVTYLFDISIALVATEFSKGGIIQVFKTSIDDLIAGVKIKKYGISFALCVLAFAGFLTYTTSSFVFVPHLKMQREFESYKKLIKNNPYAVMGNVLGDEKANVKIQLFTDYECPICRINNVMINKAMKEVKGVKIEHKNFPLDTKCNKYLSGEFHQNACLYAKYAIAAEKQGKWGLMNDALFKNQPKNEFEIVSLIENYSFDIKKLIDDANSEETYKRIQKEIDEAKSYNINGTPTYVINGVTYPGIKQYSVLKNMLKSARDGKEIKIDEPNKKPKQKPKRK
ncbi:thioredoxin domain-containing protein [bacterium]|nr:thioredoxin domain-containing protein [bacterium]